MNKFLLKNIRQSCIPTDMSIMNKSKQIALIYVKKYPRD
jgi:hypothetical protein